jgi:hypothetical protein
MELIELFSMSVAIVGALARFIGCHALQSRIGPGPPRAYFATNRSLFCTDSGCPQKIFFVLSGGNVGVARGPETACDDLAEPANGKAMPRVRLVAVCDRRSARSGTSDLLGSGQGTKLRPTKPIVTDPFASGAEKAACYL